MNLVRSDRTYLAGYQEFFSFAEIVHSLLIETLSFVELVVFLNSNIDHYIDLGMLPLITKIW